MARKSTPDPVQDAHNPEITLFPLLKPELCLRPDCDIKARYSSGGCKKHHANIGRTESLYSKREIAGHSTEGMFIIEPGKGLNGYSCGLHIYGCTEVHGARGMCALHHGWAVRYNLTEANQIFDFWNESNCHLCNRKFADMQNAVRGVNNRVYDHCHETGKVRGIVCGQCNSAMGSVGDSLSRIKNLIKYLGSAPIIPEPIDLAGGKCNIPECKKAISRVGGIICKLHKDNGRRLKLGEVDYINYRNKSKCDACGIVESKMDIDHCHETDIVRGVLCPPCNRSLGQFEDRLWVMENAVAFLNNPPYPLGENHTTSQRLIKT